MKIVAAIPTRGIVVTDTVAAVIRELSSQQDAWGIAFSVDLPIPDAHNEVVKQAIEQHNADYVWLVEEDVIPPIEALKKLLTHVEKGISVIDVPSRHLEGLTQIGQLHGRVYWCHTGCTLVKREVFEKLGEPWFENNYSYDHKVQGKEVIFTEHKLDKPQEYGGQDIRFSRKAIEAGFDIAVVPDTIAKHAVVEFATERGQYHTIKKLGTITRANAFAP